MRSYSWLLRLPTWISDPVQKSRRLRDPILTFVFGGTGSLKAKLSRAFGEHCASYGMATRGAGGGERDSEVLREPIPVDPSHNQTYSYLEVGIEAAGEIHLWHSDAL